MTKTLITYPLENTVDIPTAAKILDVSEFVIRDLIERGLVSAFKPGKRCWKIKVDSLYAYLETRHNSKLCQ
jgi:hypothetical protein